MDSNDRRLRVTCRNHVLADNRLRAPPKARALFDNLSTLIATLALPEILGERYGWTTARPLVGPLSPYGNVSHRNSPACPKQHSPYLIKGSTEPGVPWGRSIHSFKALTFTLFTTPRHTTHIPTPTSKMLFSNPLKVLAFFTLATAAAASGCVPSSTTICCVAGEYVAKNSKGKLVCKKCKAGTYNPSDIFNASDVTECKKCDAGSFQDATGATKCCSCCQGYYSAAAGASTCKACPVNKPYSIAGSDSKDDCSTTAVGGLINSCLDCGTSGGVCPSPYPPPSTSAVPKRRRDFACARNFTMCPRLSGVGGFECVDTSSDPESCGGCSMAEDPADAGVDCTAIPNVSVVNCKKNKCSIVSCRKGYTKSADGRTCRRSSVHFQERSSKH